MHAAAVVKDLLGISIEVQPLKLNQLLFPHNYCVCLQCQKYIESYSVNLLPYFVLSVSGGAPAAGQTRRDVGDAAVRAHGVPLPRLTGAAPVTLCEEHLVTVGDVLTSGGRRRIS